jgi:hypothetical protein
MKIILNHIIHLQTLFPKYITSSNHFSMTNLLILLQTQLDSTPLQELKCMWSLVCQVWKLKKDAPIICATHILSSEGM